MSHDHGHDHEVKVLTLKEVLTQWLNKKLGVVAKVPVQGGAGHAHAPSVPADVTINTIAVVLDGQVQEVIRAENRMTALLLSSPEFVVVDGISPTPTIGWEYSNGEFFSPT